MGSAGAGDGLDAAQARTTGFTPDVAGTYQVALTAGSGAAATTDVYTVTAGPAQPLVSLSVPTYGPVAAPPIEVGGVPYPPDGGVDGIPLLQIVVLDRRTLELKSNTTYPCNGFDANCDADMASKVSADLAPLVDDSLVIVSVLNFVMDEPGLADYITVGPATRNALKKIGFDPSVPFPNQPGPEQPQNTFAAVGIPDSPVGSAWVRRDTYSGDGDGSFSYLTGALTRDQNGNFLLAPTDYLPLTVRSDSTSTANAMLIGQDREQAELPPGATGGFQTVVLDGLTGDVAASEVIVTNPASESNIEQALESLNGAIDPRFPGVILVASLGSPTGQQEQMPAAWYSAWNDFGGFIEKNGGTAHGVLSMTSGEDYAMAARTGSGPAGGTEVGPAGVTPAHSSNWTPSGALSGELARNGDDWRFTPKVGAGDVIDPSQSIMQMLYQETQSFPQFDEATMNYIYGQVFAPSAPCGSCTGDVRQTYWTQDATQPLENLASTWSTWSVALTNLGPPAVAGDFAAAKAQILQELTYLEKATDYLAALEAPLSGDATKVVDDTLTSVQNGIQHLQTGNPVSLSWLKFVSDALDVGSVISLDPELAAVGGAMTKLATGLSGAADLATLAQSGPSGQGDTLQTNAGQLADKLSGQLSQTATGYSNMLPILASDYAKLQSFGGLGVCSDQTPTCPAGWLPSTADRTRAVDLWISRQGWETLLPQAVGTVAWHGNYPTGQVPDAANWHCWYREDTGPDGTQDGYDFQVFPGLAATGQTALVSSVTAAGPVHDLWALASWNRSGLLRSSVWPDSQETNELFYEVDPSPTEPNNPQYGLGFVPAHFFKADPDGPYSALDGNPSSDFRGWKTGYCQFGEIPAPAPPR
jgi:hypothetical protein